MPPSYLTAKGVSHVVNDESLTFYPLSVSHLFKLKDIARPLSKALAVLLSGNESDRGITTRFWRGPNSKIQKDEKGKPTGLYDGEGGSEDSPVLPSLEIVRFRSAERDDAIALLVDALMSQKNLDVVAGMVVDSLREERDLTAASVAASDFPTLWQFLQGVVLANTQALPPLPAAVRAKLGAPTPKEESGSTSSETRTGTAG